MRREERAQALRVVDGDGVADAWAVGQARAPRANAKGGDEDAGVDERVEDVKVAEDRAEDGVDKGEALAGEPRRDEGVLDGGELHCEGGALRFEGSGVLRDLEAPVDR